MGEDYREDDEEEDDEEDGDALLDGTGPDETRSCLHMYFVLKSLFFDQF